MAKYSLGILDYTHHKLNNSSHSPAYESGKNDVKEKNNFEKKLIRLSIHFFYLNQPVCLVRQYFTLKSIIM